MIIHIVRAVYLVVCLAITASYAFNLPDNIPNPIRYATLFMLIPALGAFAVVMVDMFWKRKHLQVLSGLFFGLLAGLVIAFVAAQIAEFAGQVFIAPEKYATEVANRQQQPPINVNVYLHDSQVDAKVVKPDQPRIAEEQSFRDEDPAVALAKILLGTSIVFLCVSFVLQTKDDFRFIIPYVEFAKQIKGPRPLLLDTSVIIDGRIADIAETRIMESQVIVPRFILDELHMVADSEDKLRRNRGRRGLDILNRLQESKRLDIQIIDIHVPLVEQAGETDAKLLAMAKHLDGRIMTTDYNLNKVAQVRGVDVININDLANALRPVVLPGEMMTVKIIKPGEESGQGIGYLEDGTMVVTEQGHDYIGKEVAIAVTSVLQTSAGRMIFGKIGQQKPNGGGRS